MQKINRKNKLRNLYEDKKGIETRVLIYVLAAIALIFALGIVGQVNDSASKMVDDALAKAGEAAGLNSGGSGSATSTTTGATTTTHASSV